MKRTKQYNIFYNVRAIKAKQPVVVKRAKQRKAKTVNQETLDFVQNLIIDEDTGAPIGIGFDHLIRAVKSSQETRG